MPTMIFYYEKHVQSLNLYRYRTKAKFNEENFQIMNLFKKQPDFKVLFLQVDKDFKKQGKVFLGSTQAMMRIAEDQENKFIDGRQADEAARQKIVQAQNQTSKFLEGYMKQHQRLNEQMAELKAMIQGRKDEF